jgi:hypothetical protein
VPLFTENPGRLILGKPEVFAVQLGKIITRCGGQGEDKGCVQLVRCLVSPLHYRREVVTMKKDVPIEIEIEVVEAGQPRPQRPGPEPSNTKGLRPFSIPGAVRTICGALTSGTCEGSLSRGWPPPSAAPCFLPRAPVG